MDHSLLHSEIKRVIEALLFASYDPLPFAKIAEIVKKFSPLRSSQIRELITELKMSYLEDRRAFRLEEIAKGFLLRTCEEYRFYIEELQGPKHGMKLSTAATEVLAIIAYKQPVTRVQIDSIRGVDSSGTLTQLLERNLIQGLERLETPGRPVVYGITKEFLTHFGLNDAAELPRIGLTEAAV